MEYIQNVIQTINCPVSTIVSYQVTTHISKRLQMSNRQLPTGNLRSVCISMENHHKYHRYGGTLGHPFLWDVP